MNREDAKKLWPVIKAFSEGEEVQAKLDTGEWHSFSIHADFDPDYEWRIKPKPFECWVNVYNEGEACDSVNHSKEAAERHRPLGCGRTIHMQEIEE